MDKQEMIEQLIDDDINTILYSGVTADYLSNILRLGIGYELQTEAEIAIEYNSRTWENE